MPLSDDRRPSRNTAPQVTEAQIVRAVASQYLDRLRNKTEVLESVDARLEALMKKLAWLSDARNKSLLSAEELEAQRAEVLAAFNDVEP